MAPDRVGSRLGVSDRRLTILVRDFLKWGKWAKRQLCPTTGSITGRAGLLCRPGIPAKPHNLWLPTHPRPPSLKGIVVAMSWIPDYLQLSFSICYLPDGAGSIFPFRSGGKVASGLRKVVVSVSRRARFFRGGARVRILFSQYNIAIGIQRDTHRGQNSAGKVKEIIENHHRAGGKSDDSTPGRTYSIC